MTDVDRRSVGRLMALTALLKNLIFIKCFGFSAGTSLSHRSKQPVFGNVQDVQLLYTQQKSSQGLLTPKQVLLKKCSYSRYWYKKNFCTCNHILMVTVSLILSMDVTITNICCRYCRCLLIPTT